MENSYPNHISSTNTERLSKTSKAKERKCSSTEQDEDRYQTKRQPGKDFTRGGRTARPWQDTYHRNYTEHFLSPTSSLCLITGVPAEMRRGSNIFTFFSLFLITKV
ncbi:hypothetical protein XENORESO_022101 [Xenotaenia resolanae]|uniref:Uncharacterized protein n=1 Tax=Xenotaenia resolanae TaxID=208358 RepID=A0ABV0VXS0_9TELE